MARDKLAISKPGREAAEEFVGRYFADLVCPTEADDQLEPDFADGAPENDLNVREDAIGVSSDVFRGGQSHADKALSHLDLNGYSRNRTQAYPERRRAASRLSPYIRHGLIDLPKLWESVDGPENEVDRFRLELLWQEYARHLYARLGSGLKEPLRYQSSSLPAFEPTLDQSMGCVEITTGELEDDGWLVGQSRLWLASHWSVRQGGDWQEGEDYFFRHLLDGSRAANRLGWQAAAGLISGRPYNFTRWQVESKAAGLCASCDLNANCPIDRWPERSERPQPAPVDNENPLLFGDPNLAATVGPTAVHRAGVDPDAVWVTAESMGDNDPALRANPDLPLIFVFDKPLLSKLQLSSKRLVFMVETLAELATKRDLQLYLGSPTEILGGRKVSATYSSVPGWKRIAGAVKPVETHPWRWLHQPGRGDISSFDRWRQQLLPETEQNFWENRASGQYQLQRT